MAVVTIIRYVIFGGYYQVCSSFAFSYPQFSFESGLCVRVRFSIPAKSLILLLILLKLLWILLIILLILLILLVILLILLLIRLAHLGRLSQKLF